MKRIFSILAATAILNFAIANDEVTKEVTEQTTNITPTADADISVVNVAKPKKINIRELVNKAKNELKSKNKDAQIYTKIVPVDVRADDPRYYDYLVMAYNQALLELKAEVVLKKSGDLLTKQAYEYYNKTISPDKHDAQLEKAVNEKLNARDYEDIGDKLINATKMILDKIADNVTPENRTKIRAEVSDTLFNKSFKDLSRKQGEDEIRGLIPYENYIVTDDDGKVKIAVLAYTTPKSIQLARDLRQGNQSKKTQKTEQCKSALEITEAIPDDQLLSKLGLKFFYNENCSPSLLAFGFDGYKKGDDLEDDRANESETRAQTRAESVISNFLNSNVEAVIEDSVITEKIKEVVMSGTKLIGNDKVDYNKKVSDPLSDLTKEMSKKFESSSRMKLRGLENVRIWEQDVSDEYGVVGVMVYYSMDSIKAANEQFNENKAIEKAQGKKTSVKGGVKKSSNLDVDDF